MTRKGKEEGMVLVNIFNEQKQISIKNETLFDVESDQQINTNLTLKPYEVRILKINK